MVIQKKKNWEAPTVESLSVKSNTMTGMRRGRNRGRMKYGKNAQIDPDPPLASS